MRPRNAIIALTLLLTACPSSIRKINQLALKEALRAGPAGSLPFTVALRNAVARLTGNRALVSLTARRIEYDAMFRKNLVEGVQNNMQSTIFNGTSLSAGDHTYDSVVVILDSQRTVQCTGIAMTATRVLTAGHCVDNVDWVHEGNSVAGPSLVAITGSAKFAAADVGMLFLDGSGVSTTTFGQRAATSDIDGAKLMRAMGYGSNVNGVKGTKAYTDVAIDRYHCAASDQTTFGCSTADEMVADNKVNNADTCEGDSGGPAFVAPAGVPQVAGVISRGVKPGRDCIDGSVYVRVDSTAIGKFINEAQPTVFRKRRAGFGSAVN